MKKNGLQTITDDEIKKAYEYQLKNKDWTFYQEKELAETTYHNRINFLLLAYSLFLNAYFAVTTTTDKLSISIIGLIITYLLTLTIFRARARFVIMVQILNICHEKGAFPILIKEYKAGRKSSFLFFQHHPSVTIGYIIPGIMIISFIAGIVYNSFVMCHQ